MTVKMARFMVMGVVVSLITGAAIVSAQRPDPERIRRAPHADVHGVARGKLSPEKQIQYDVNHGARPTSTSPLLDAGKFPSNVVKILRTTNKAQVNSYVPVVFTLNHNNPFNVIRFLRRPVQLEEGALFTFVNPDGKSGKVLYVVPDYMVPSLRELVASVDRPELTTSAGDALIYRQLKHRRADPSDPGFLSAALSYTTQDGNKFIVDPEENALFVKDAPSGGKSFEAALDNSLDVPTAMLELKVTLYELDATNDATVGLDYMAWKNGPGANLFALGAYAEHGGMGHQENPVMDPIGTGASALPRNNFTATGYNYAYSLNVPSAFFDFLAAKGKARVLNSVKLVALNTQPAVLTTGDQLLYYAVRTTDPANGGIRNTNTPFQDNASRVVVGTDKQLNASSQLVPVQTGLTLTVTPLISQQTIKMDLDLQWSDYKFPDASGLPLINPRHLTTRIRGKVGDEILIGGLDRQSAVKSAQKMPILGSLPLLGYLFGKETQQTRHTRMVAAICPTAVMNYDVAKDYKVHEDEQVVIDRASGAKPLHEPKASWGFDMPGLDKEAGATEPPVK